MGFPYTDFSDTREVDSMKCPACGALMIVVEHEHIELDFCADCSGVWFDAGELALLLETMQLDAGHLALDDVLTSSEARSNERKRRCPICGHRMKKATVGHQPEVLIDACPRGDGLWFDSGEVGQLITQLPDRAPKEGDSQARLVAFLGEVFQARSE
ncbi:MAG: zf-TFIIB domain-containing protein [Chloroflexota bacterium]